MRRERRDNLEPLDQLEDEDDPGTMDPKETLYDANMIFMTFLRTLGFMVKGLWSLSLDSVGSCWFPWRSWSSW